MTGILSEVLKTLSLEKLREGQMSTTNLPDTIAQRNRSSRSEMRDSMGSDRFAPSAQGFKI